MFIIDTVYKLFTHNLTLCSLDENLKVLYML